MDVTVHRFSGTDDLVYLPPSPLQMEQIKEQLAHGNCEDK